MKLARRFFGVYLIIISIGFFVLGIYWAKGILVLLSYIHGADVYSALFRQILRSLASILSAILFFWYALSIGSQYQVHDIKLLKKILLISGIVVIALFLIIEGIQMIPRTQVRWVKEGNDYVQRPYATWYRTIGGVGIGLSGVVGVILYALKLFKSGLDMKNMKFNKAFLGLDIIIAIVLPTLFMIIYFVNN